LQLSLQARIEEARDGFLSRAEDYLGLKIQYGSMGPSIFGVLDIRDVRILRSGESEDESVLLSVSRLRLSYSLVTLLKGSIQDAFRSARIDRPVLNLDFRKDAHLVEHISSLRQSSPSSSNTGKMNLRELLPENFSLRILNGEWDFFSAAGRFRLHSVGLDAAVRQNRVSFQGRWNASGSLSGEAGSILSAFKSEQSLSVFHATMTGKISGEYFEDTEEGSATVVIPSFYGDNFNLKPLTVSFFLSGGRLETRKTHDRSPAAISMVYDFEDNRLLGRFEGENFSLGDLFNITESWKKYDHWLAFRISGNADIEKTSSGALLYNMDFSGSLPENSSFGPASLVVKASGDEEQVRIDTLDIHSYNGSLNFRGGMNFNLIAPYGSLSLLDFRLQRESPLRPNSGVGWRDGLIEGPVIEHGISGDFSLSTRGREINLFCENLSAGDANLSALDLSLYREEDGLILALSTLSFKEMKGPDIDSYENFRMGILSLEAFVDYNPRQLRASLRLDSFSVGDILSLLEPLAPLPDLPFMARSAAEDLSITTEVFFTTDYEQILYNAPRFVATYEGLGDILAAASLSGTNRRLDLNDGRISWKKGTAEISASVDFSVPEDISFSMGTTHKDLTYYFEGMIMDHRNVSIRGSYGFQLNLSGTRAGAYSGFAMGDNIPLPSGDKFASLSFLSSFYYVSPSSWQASIEKFEISGLTTPSSPFAYLKFTGTANERGMDIPNITFDDGRGVLGGDISLHWNSSYSYYHFRGDINGNNQRELYSLNGTYENNKLALVLTVLGMQFSRVSSQNATADGKLRLSWESIRSFEAEAELYSLVLYKQEEPVKVSALANMNNETFQLRQMDFRYSGLELSVPSLTVSLAASRAETEGSIRGNLSQKPVDVSFRGEAAFNSTETWLDMLSGLVSLEGSLTFDNARYDTIEATEPFDLSFSCLQGKNGFSLNLAGGPQNMVRFRYTPEVAGGGSFFAALSAPSPFRGAINGFIDSNSIDAQTSDLYVDLTSLWRFMPSDIGVAFPRGIVTGSVRVTGSLSDPEFYGTARGTSVHILVPDFLPEPIQPAPVTFLLTGTEMTFGPVDSYVGNGGGIVSAWFRFEQWIPNIFSIDIQVPPESPIPYAFDISGLLAHGLASGKLIVAMEDLVLTVTGDLTAHNTEISLNSSDTEDYDSDSNPGLITTITDISIRAGRRVEFFWPSVEFPMLQATADIGTGIHVTSDSVSKRFTLNGNVNLRGGELFYLERNFYIREGTLYLRENETEFNPRISARAEIRDRTEEGPVTISLIIDRAPLMSFTPRFESSPPLSQMEIFSLLGQNPQGEGGSQRNIAASAAIDTLAQFTVVRRLQRQVRDFLGLDMLSVRTQVFQNVVLQATGTQPGANDDNVDRPYRVGNYFDNTTVFMGKYFGADVFGQAMLTVKYDENKVTMGGIKLEPELGIEMRNPLFDVRFNMVPLHPQNWFIDDVSFSLIWRRSF